MMKFMSLAIFLLVMSAGLTGCETSQGSGEKMPSYGYPLTEMDWIRNGEPIEFEGDVWYPTDQVENLLDPEVYPLGQYHGAQFFIDRTDVKPYDRLYTRFSKNRYRAFEKRL